MVPSMYRALTRARAAVLATTALAVVAAVAGCAQLAPMPSGSPETGGFELSGRVAVRYGQESATGRVQWRHGEASDDLLITNPLGQGVARLTRARGEVELRTSEGREYRAGDAEALTQKVLGWRLPLEGLPQWVRAQPRPGRPAEVERDPSQRVTVMRQDDWRIDYEDYAGERPSRMRLSRPDLEIRLIIESWQASAP
jgi:outer membrane lipoprotein LolB